MLPSDIVTKLNECAKTDFAGMRDGWFRIVSWATALVAFGLVLEAPELVHDLVPIGRKIIARLKKLSIEFPKHEAPDWVKVVAFVGWIFIVGGVVGEEFAGIKVQNLDANIQECSDAKVQAATLEAGDAAASAKTAHTEADAIKKEADELTTRLDAASRQLANVEQDTLAEGPRWRLLKNGEDVFVKALKPFAGQRATVVICGNVDVERSGLEQLIINLFREAKWDSPGYVRWPQCPNMLSGGIDIYFVAAIDDSAEWASLPAQQWAKAECGRFNISHDASNTLCDVLYKLGIFTTAFREKPLPLEVGAERARAFFEIGIPDGPAEMAYKDPGRIFLLIGPNAPMFTSKNKNVKHK